MTLNTRERNIAIGVGVAVALYVLNYLFYEPLATQLEQANALIDQHRAELATSSGTLQNSLVAKRKWKALTENHLAPDASTAEVVLLNRVRDAAQEAGLALGQSSRSTFLKQGGFDTVTRQFSGEGSMGQLSRFIFALNQSNVPLRVVDLTIASAKDGTDDLTMTCGVSTLYESADPASKVAQAVTFSRGL